ncbi:F-box-like domain containing protein [Ceratobasidium theobromae]|uniref:F-box-like domain containing protein n=1 Tax=Ceratobasidium theobromae TaxID=1582974 RepID=A0A5N5Q983_9AGAM|nr:F-box-like domain containing protein [Ceratobasidium theobromae]
MTAEVITELNAASDLLRAAMGRYLKACIAMQNYSFKNHTHSHKLSIRAASELPLVASIESKFQQAKAAISRTRNNSSSISPVGALPPEILSRIFHLVLQLSPRPCTSAFVWRQLPYTGESLISEHPDLLAHVCSRWRQVAISDPTLWSHINITPSLSPSQKLLGRAQVYAARADPLPLDIDIVDGVSSMHPDRRSPVAVNVTPVQFLASVATRIRSLELITQYPTTSQEEFISILITCFTLCVPGTLRRLTMLRKHSSDMGRISGRPCSLGNKLSFLSHDQQRLESILSSLNSLQLDGWYIDWSSRAYHGLTELHLTSVGLQTLYIFKSELLAILKSSPALRIFQFGLKMDNDIPDELETSILDVPVPLDNLEVLSLISVGHGSLGTVLQILAPGSKPLQLSIDDPYKYADEYLFTVIAQFLARSNVTKLQVRARGSRDTRLTTGLLGLIPHLRALVLVGYSCDYIVSTSGLPFEFREPDKPYCLDALYVVCCRIFTHDGALLQLVKKHSFQKLVFFECSFSGRLSPPAAELEELRSTLSAFCPVVQFVRRDDPNPIEDWDIDPSVLEDFIWD